MVSQEVVGASLDRQPQAAAVPAGVRARRRHLPARCASVIVFLAMFVAFTATDRWTKKPVHCIYQALIVAISTRHADAVDVKFLVDGRTVWVALPHPAWVEYKNRTGTAITDSLAVEIAGHYLKAALQAGAKAWAARCTRLRLRKRWRISTRLSTPCSRRSPLRAPRWQPASSPSSTLRASLGPGS